MARPGRSTALSLVATRLWADEGVRPYMLPIRVIEFQDANQPICAALHCDSRAYLS
jgi:hypothetical protein